MSVTVDTHELDELAATLVAAGVKTGVKAAAVVSVEANTIRAEAAARSPRLTGALAAGWYVTDAGPGVKVVTNDTREAFYQEFGTSVMAPQPSLFPATDGAMPRLALAIEAVADPFL